MARTYNDVLFRPWEGASYDNSPLGLKLLVLGESHYRHANDKSPEEMTTIEAMNHGRHTHRFWVSLSNLIGKHQAPYQVKIWDSVVFYNYVQHVVGTGPRQRPAPYMWTSPRTVAGFSEVLRVACPDRILVVGKHNWDMMAGALAFPETPPIREERFKLPPQWKDADGLIPHAYWYPTSPGKYALCAPIYHPAYPRGFYAPSTARTVDKLLRKDWNLPSIA